MQTYVDPDTGEKISTGEIPLSANGAASADESQPHTMAIQGKAGDNVIELLKRVKAEAPGAIKQIEAEIQFHESQIEELRGRLSMLGATPAPAKTRKARGPNKPKPAGTQGAQVVATAPPAATPPPAPAVKRAGRPAGSKNKAAEPLAPPAPRGWPKGKLRGPRK